MATYHPGAHDPDRAAVIGAQSGASVTFGQLEARSRRLAQHLRRTGLEPGDHVGLLLRNDVRYFEICWAYQRAGLTYTPVNWHLKPDEVAHIVGDSGMRFLVTSDDLDADAPRRLVVGSDEYEAIVSEGSKGEWTDVEGVPMFYSSGTTGRPKGVRQARPTTPYGAPGMHVDLARTRWGLGPDAVHLSPGPLYHAGPLVRSMTALRVGATVVVMDRFDPETALAAIERFQVTSALLVPTMFVRLLKLPEEVRSRYDLHSLQRVWHAAAPCPVWVKEAMLDWWGPIIWEYYSSTESAGMTVIGPDESRAHPGSVGRPLDCTIHIVGADDAELPPGVPGRVMFERPGPQFRYHGDEAKTAASRDRHGWVTVGDIGYLDPEGFLHLTDRADFVINAGGVNVYPQEAEDVLLAHPAVDDVAVLGVPDDDLGQQVKAVIQLAPGYGPEVLAELDAFARARLAAYKCPRSYDVVDELPRLESGKLAKHRLREHYWSGRPDRLL